MIEIARRCLGEGEVAVGVVEAAAPLSEGDRAFLETAKTNMTAIDLWGQEYLAGDTGPGDVAVFPAM